MWKIKFAKKAGRRVVKKEKEPHNKAMIAKSDEHANIL